jgi:hypothetical protein
MGRGQHMAGLPEADELLEVARHELAARSEMIPGRAWG